MLLAGRIETTTQGKTKIQSNYEIGGFDTGFAIAQPYSTTEHIT